MLFSCNNNFILNFKVRHVCDNVASCFACEFYMRKELNSESGKNKKIFKRLRQNKNYQKKSPLDDKSRQYQTDCVRWHGDFIAVGESSKLARARNQ